MEKSGSVDFHRMEQFFGMRSCFVSLVFLQTSKNPHRKCKKPKVLGKVKNVKKQKQCVTSWPGSKKVPSLG